MGEASISEMDMLVCRAQSLAWDEKGTMEECPFKHAIDVGIVRVKANISLCPFVALSKEKFDEHEHIVLSTPYYKLSVPF